MANNTVPARFDCAITRAIIEEGIKQYELERDDRYYVECCKEDLAANRWEISQLEHNLTWLNEHEHEFYTERFLTERREIKDQIAYLELEVQRLEDVIS